MFARRSSEASSCLMRFCTETLSAASVRGVTVPVGARPWRDLEAFDAPRRRRRHTAPVALSAARSPLIEQALAQQIVMRALHADGEFGVGGNRRPAAAHRDIGIAQRGLPDPLRGALVVGRLVRQRQRRGGARFRGGCGGGRLGRRRMRGGLCRAARAAVRPAAGRRRTLAKGRRGRKHRGNGKDRHSSHVGCPWYAARAS